MLTVTSVATRTSPVSRGKWILENLLGTPAPVPPPGVETNLEKDPVQVKTTSVRQRMEAHRANPACASCHKIMDPIGLSLENFDQIGTWRERDSGYLLILLVNWSTVLLFTALTTSGRHCSAGRMHS